VHGQHNAVCSNQGQHVAPPRRRRKFVTLITGKDEKIPELLLRQSCMPNVNVWKSAQSGSMNVNFIWSRTSYRSSMSQARPVYWQKNTNPINNKQWTSLISKYWNKSSVSCMLSSSLLLSYYNGSKSHRLCTEQSSNVYTQTSRHLHPARQ